MNGDSEYILASVASAQTAAAVMQMREDAAKRCYDDQGRFDTPDRIRALTLPDTTALDALIAERVKEAVEAEREAIAALIDERCAEILSKQDGTIPQVDTNLQMIALLLPDLSDVIRARASKEGW